ncbi:snoRNA-binding rRNA-processing protein [Physocladia obscura]|uniref:SnoRNA-binding rRNA-processing protein n=1 Tax=Physocladia obscura TaxID=109957 RepID=A0AAD5SV00_9FUNG|nr:snoRNA-binding rRNA-processing protein [Physocladia obscura]
MNSLLNENQQSPVLVKEYASVSHVEFCPAKPHDFAVTSSTRVQIYSCASHTVKKTLSRFKETAYSGSFRSDGKILVAADYSGAVQIFDLSSRAILRTFSGHKDTVRVAKFSSNVTQVLTASDDKTVRIWDLPSESALYVFDDHQDHVRSAAISPDNPNIILTGSYDHTVRLWDTRSPTPNIATMQHNHPVESVLFLPGSSLIASAGSNKLKIWNVLAGCSHFQTLSNHQKSITTMCMDGSGRRLLTGSLDNQVKIYNIEDYQVSHSLKYPAPILSMAVSPDDTHIVVGMASGLLSIRQRVVKTHEIAQVATARATQKARGGTLAHFTRGSAHRAGPDDLRVEERRKQKMKEYDQMLRAFRYGDALDSALRTAQAAGVVVSLVEELVHRGGLGIALGARDDAGLEPVARFVVENIANPRFTATLVFVAETILDMYAPVIGQSVLIDELFLKLRTNIERELSLQQTLKKTMGLLESVMLASQKLI